MLILEPDTLLSLLFFINNITNNTICKRAGDADCDGRRDDLVEYVREGVREKLLLCSRLKIFFLQLFFKVLNFNVNAINY